MPEAVLTARAQRSPFAESRDDFTNQHPGFLPLRRVPVRGRYRFGRRRRDTVRAAADGRRDEVIRPERRGTMVTGNRRRTRVFARNRGNLFPPNDLSGGVIVNLILYQGRQDGGAEGGDRRSNYPGCGHLLGGEYIRGNDASSFRLPSRTAWRSAVARQIWRKTIEG